MLSYLATEACIYAIKLIYIPNCFALKLIVMLFHSKYISFSQPQLFYLNNYYLSEAGLFRKSLTGHHFEGIALSFYINFKMYSIKKIVIMNTTVVCHANLIEIYY